MEEKLFMEFIRFQIVDIAVLLVLLKSYFSGKRIPLLSTKCFSAMLITACVNLVFDVASVYAITHFYYMPLWLVRLIHQVFIGTLMIMIFMMFLYVVFLGRQQRRLKWYQIVLIISPFLAGLYFVIFGELNYYHTMNSYYSYGPMAYSLYAVLAVYMLATNFYVILHKKNYRRETRYAIRTGALLWIVAGIIQAVFKQLLISGVGVMLMMLHLYLSLESPSELYDVQSNSFNRRAFNLYVSEALGRKKPAYVVNIVFTGLVVVQSKFGFQRANEMLGEFAKAIMEKCGKEKVFHYRGNALAIFVEAKKQDVNVLCYSLDMAIKEVWTREKLCYISDYHMDVLECPKYALTSAETVSVLDFMYDFPIEHKKYIRFVDETHVERMKRDAAIDVILDRAIQSDGFSVVLQPIYSHKNKCFSSAEALVRIKDTTTVGFISPDVFIPIAERKGVVSKIDEIVFTKVCELAKEEKLWDMGVEYIEVNLSGIDASETGTASNYERIMERIGVPASFFNFEITETAAVEAGESVRENIKRFTDLGSNFSIDDFGTGYSNLAQLAAMTYSLVKIDKSLIWPCFDDSNKVKTGNATVILESVAMMANKLGKGMVAEGVETKEQADKLISLGVDHLQGYYFSRPIPPEEYVKFIKENNKKQAKSKKATV